MADTMSLPAVEAAAPRKKPLYTDLSFQVLVGIAVAIAYGYINPAQAAAMKPLGDAFIRLITMIITLVIFCTVVSGIAGIKSVIGWQQDSWSGISAGKVNRAGVASGHVLERIKGGDGNVKRVT